MILLALEHVCKRYRRGRRQQVALDDVSLSVEAGELVAIWGAARSGRTTLLRVASGIEQPDAGVVRFAGRPVTPAGGEGLVDGIGLVRVEPSDLGGEAVVDLVAMPLLARGTPPSVARAAAMRQLERVGAVDCAALEPRDVTPTELVQVAIAQALAASPRLLLVDDPTRHVDLLERETVLRLLRTVAVAGVGVLMTTGEAMGVAGADRVLTLGDGVLRAQTTADTAHVVALRGSGPPHGLSAQA